MNDKILIVEDRVNRIEQWLGKEETKKLKNSVLVMTTLPDARDGEEYNFHKLDDFKLVAIHLSYLSGSRQTKFYEYIASSKNFYIIFSGGIMQETILYGGHLANLPIQRLYTKDIVERLSRLDFSEHTLLKFLYGDNWELPLLQRLRMLNWLFPSKEDQFEEKDSIARILGNPKDINAEIYNIYNNY